MKNISHHKTDDHIKFRCSIDDNAYEEIITYNELMDFIQKNMENDDIVWVFQRIIGHQSPLKLNDPKYMGSRFKIRIKWENGEITYEPLDIIAADNPVTCAIYTRKNSLLDELGWTSFWHFANCEKHLLHLVKGAKMQSFKATPHYKFGYPVPHTYDEAL